MIYRKSVCLRRGKLVGRCVRVCECKIDIARVTAMDVYCLLPKRERERRECV